MNELQKEIENKLLKGILKEENQIKRHELIEEYVDFKRATTYVNLSI